MTPCVSPVWDTAQAVFALGEAGMPADDPRMIKAADWMLSKEVRHKGDWAVKVPNVEPGGWYFEFNNEFYPDTDDTAQVLMAINKVDNPREGYQHQVAERAIALVRNRDAAVPLAASARACFVVLPETRYSSQGQVFAQEVRKRQPGATLLNLDPTMPLAGLNDAVAALSACPSYVVAAYSTVSVGAGSVGLGGDLPALVRNLTASGKPVTLIALGNPYLLRDFPNAAAYLATFSTVPPSETAAARALYGEIPIRGRLPVSIPGQASYGDGIQLGIGNKQ